MAVDPRHPDHSVPGPNVAAPLPEPDHDDAYPFPKIRLARNWVQPKRPFNFDKDYHRLPRFRPDFGREPIQHARR